MKLSEFPYERVDFTKMEKELSDLAKALDKAESVEEVFSIHKKYYKMQDDVMTAMVLANFRNNIDMTDEFSMRRKRTTMTKRCRAFGMLWWNTRRSSIILHSKKKWKR